MLYPEMINNNWSRSNVIVYAKGGKNGLTDFFAANKGIFLTKGLIYYFLVLVVNRR